MISSSSPSSLGDAGAEFGAVLGGAAGFGRDQPRAGDAAVLHLVAADGERVDGAVDRRLAQAAGSRNALAQPDDAGKRIDDAEAVAGRPRDQQPAIIGAEIERGIGRAAAIGAPMLAVSRSGDRRPHRGRACGARSIAGSRPGASPASPLIVSKPSCRAAAPPARRLRQCSNDRAKV